MFWSNVNEVKRGNIYMSLYVKSKVTETLTGRRKVGIGKS